MMSQKHDEDNPIDEKAAAVSHGGNKDPLEQMLAMKDEQIRELKNDLVKKENQMDKREKEAREEFSKKEKELKEEIEEVRGQLGQGNNELNKSNIEHKIAIRTGEHYWMATIIILTVIIMACVAVIVEKQIEAHMCWNSQIKIENLVRDAANLEIKTLVKDAANLKIEEKTNHAVIMKKKQNDQFLNWINMKGVKDCQTRLRDIETSTQRVISLAVERDKLATKYNTCSEKLTTCETTKTS